MLNDHSTQHRPAFSCLFIFIVSNQVEWIVQRSIIFIELYAIDHSVLYTRKCSFVCLFLYIPNIIYLIIKFVKQYVNYEHTNGGYYELKRRKLKQTEDLKFEQSNAIVLFSVYHSLLLLQLFGYLFCYFYSFSTNSFCARYAGTRISHIRRLAQHSMLISNRSFVSRHQSRWVILHHMSIEFPLNFCT